MNKLGIIKATNDGFFSNFRNTLYTFYDCEQKGLLPYIEWDSGWYFDPKKGPNAWEYYFDQIASLKPNQERILVKHDRSWDKQSFTRDRAHNLIKKYIRVKPHIQGKINLFWEANSSPNVLGVHLRLTDKFHCTKYGEPASGRPVDINAYIKHIKIYLTKHPEAKIFLATDSIDSIELLTQEFGDKLFYRKDVIRSTGDKSVHIGMEGDRYQKGEDVLIDCLLLSKCNFLFKGISNVAVCALFFNNELEHFNLNEYYNKDMRESFIKHNLDYV